MTTINPVFIIGAGAVGIGLAHALRDCSIELKGIWSRSERDVTQLPDETPLFVDWSASGLQEALHASRTVVLAVSDDAISTCSAELLER